MHGYIDTAKKIAQKGKKAFAKGKEAYVKGKGYYEQYKGKAEQYKSKAGGQPVNIPAPPSPEPSWFEANGKFVLLGAGALLLIVLMRKK